MNSIYDGSSPYNVSFNFTGDDNSRDNKAGRFDECDPSYIQCQIQKQLFVILGPILLAISLIGCILGIAVMRRPSLRKSPSSYLIICLAITDTTAVYVGLIRHLILKTSGVDIRQLSEGACRAQRYFLYWSLDTSAWLLAVISFERFIAIWFPQWHSRFNGHKRVIILICLVGLLQMLFNTQVLVLRGRQEKVIGDKTITIECGYTSPASKEYWTYTYNILSLLDYCVIPSFLMLLFNSLIIGRLCRKTRNLRNKKNTTQYKSVKITTSTTKMLLTVTLYFVVVTFPSTVFSYQTDSLFYNSKIEAERYAKLELADAIFTMLLYMNHSANFFLYCVSSKRYRRELVAMLQSWSCKAATSEVSLNSTCINNMHQIYPVGHSKVSRDSTTHESSE